MHARVTLICGNTQQGKSTLALRRALDEWDRVVVLDSARSRVFNRISAGGHFPDFETLAAWLVGPGSTLTRWAVALRAKSPDDYAAVLRASEHFRNILIVCDETHKLCRLPGVREPLELVALTGAHYGDGTGVGLFMVSQRPGSVPINIRSQAERVICFRQREPRDIAWLAEWSGDEEWAAGVAGLADHAWTEYPRTTSTVKKGSEDAQVATLDHQRSGHRGDTGDHRAVVPEAEQGERGGLSPEHRLEGSDN
jgi:hypothetical protein